MPLFDFLTDTDPNQAAQFALAAGLLGGRGSFNEILGKSLMGGHIAGQNAAAIQRQAKLDDLQKQRFQLALEEENRRKKQYDALEEFRKSIQSPEMMASQAALAGGGGPTVANAAKIASVDPLTSMAYKGMQAGAIDPMAWLNAQRKDTTPIKLGAGEKLLKPGTYQELASNPKEGAEDKDVAFLKMVYGEGTPEYQSAVKQLAAKRITHPEGVSVTYGAPMAGVDTAGKSVFFQPDKKGGPPNIVPGVAPPKDPNALKLGEAQKKQVIGIDALGSAVDEYVKELDNFPLSATLSPDARARMGTKYNNMMLQAKEAYNLGVLNGPDYQILQSVVADPVSIRGMTTSNRSLAGQAKELKRMMQTIKSQITQKTGEGWKIEKE